jgi:hypothetical protein
MAVCGNCGVIAPSATDKCDACKAPLDEQTRRTVPDREDGRYWVQVRAQFKCKHCDKRSPVNHIDVDGTFTCLRCMRDQGADAGIWATGLRFCHEVGDLAGPDPEGRHPHPEVQLGKSNKWADIGIERTRARLDFTETVIGGGGVTLKSLFVHARPGVPLCPTCHDPLEVSVDDVCELRARCAHCHETASYQVDSKAHRMVKGFVGALSDDHRADRPATKVAPARPEAPVAIECPGCGAPLGLQAKDHFVTCSFCSTPSKIPSRVRAQLFTDGVELEPFWLLFEGPSQARKKLEKKALSKKRKAEAQQRKEHQEREADQAAAEKNAKHDEAQARSQRQLSILLTVMVIAVLAYVFLVQ